MMPDRYIGGYSVGVPEFPGYHAEREFARPDGSRYWRISSYGRNERVVEEADDRGR